MAENVYVKAFTDLPAKTQQGRINSGATLNSVGQEQQSQYVHYPAPMIAWIVDCSKQSQRLLNWTQQSTSSEARTVRVHNN